MHLRAGWSAEGELLGMLRRQDHNLAIRWPRGISPLSGYMYKDDGQPLRQEARAAIGDGRNTLPAIWNVQRGAIWSLRCGDTARVVMCNADCRKCRTLATHQQARAYQLTQAHDLGLQPGWKNASAVASAVNPGAHRRQARGGAVGRGRCQACYQVQRRRLPPERVGDAVRGVQGVRVGAPQG